VALAAAAISAWVAANGTAASLWMTLALMALIALVWFAVIRRRSVAAPSREALSR
jgi:MYXO-CTERM domain-containing protein